VPALPVTVTVGTPIVRAAAVAFGPAPASFTACTVTWTASSSPKPFSVTDVPVTSVGRPPASTTYRSIGRPFSSAVCHRTWTAPR
jgi:hypothetical protein